MVRRGGRLNKKHQKGFLNHLRALQWLTDKEYFVFDNVSGLGPCDVIALDIKGNTILIDVKSVSYRKNGSVIYRMVNKRQKLMGIKLLMVTKEGKCYFNKS